MLIPVEPESLISSATSRLLEIDLPGGAKLAVTNKRRTLLKILYWEGSGLWVLAKRLERGIFARPKGTDIKDGKLRHQAA